MKFRLIEDRRDTSPVRLMCNVMAVSPAGYYAWRGRPESPRKTANRALLTEIQRVHAAHRGRYGAPRVHATLCAEGHKASRCRVERLMRHHGIRAQTPRRFRVCSTAITICPFQHIGYIRCVHFAPNRLDRNFAVERPNQVWLAGIAYVPSDEGWLTLAAVLDPCTRKIIGWAMRDHMRAELTTAALTMAVQRQKPPQGLIHHSDRGSQYAAAEYRKLIKAAGMVQSMSRKGDCRDCESVGALGGPDPCCD
jgi:transposase InsO family protein